MIRRFIGIDPGPTPGVVLLFTDGNVLRQTDVLQCSARLAPQLLKSLVAVPSGRTVPTLVQIEQFVVSARAGRSATASAGGVTREQIGRLVEVCDEHAVTHVERPAVAVKPWASDARLDAAGLLAATKGMRHARDAARHALFLAVKDGGLPDPLSKYLAERSTDEDHEEVEEQLRPLDSIADSLRRVTAILERRDAEDVAEDQTQKNFDELDQEYRQLEDLHDRKQALIEQVLELCKPSTSKLANKIREVLEPPVAPSTEPDPGTEEPEGGEPT